MSNSANGLRAARGTFQFLCIVILLLACCRLFAQNKDEEHRVRNVVLVHGAWADGSGWKMCIRDRLTVACASLTPAF